MLKFKDIKINTWFTYNGAKWYKKTSRTALLHGSKMLLYYFRQNETISKKIIVDDGYYNS